MAIFNSYVKLPEGRLFHVPLRPPFTGSFPGNVLGSQWLVDRGEYRWVSPKNNQQANDNRWHTVLYIKLTLVFFCITQLHNKLNYEATIVEILMGLMWIILGIP